MRPFPYFCPVTDEAEPPWQKGTSPKTSFSGDASPRSSQARTLLILPHLGGGDSLAATCLVFVMFYCILVLSLMRGVKGKLLASLVLAGSQL